MCISILNTLLQFLFTYSSWLHHFCSLVCPIDNLSLISKMEVFIFSILTWFLSSLGHQHIIKLNHYLHNDFSQYPDAHLAFTY